MTAERKDNALLFRGAMIVSPAEALSLRESSRAVCVTTHGQGGSLDPYCS